MEELYRRAVKNLRSVSLLHRYRITKALSGMNIYRGQPDILGYLLSHGDCSQKELAESLGISPASIATSLKRMSKSGFVERTEDEDDRRINRISVTARGKDVFLAGKTECDKVDSAMFAGFSSEEIKSFSDMLERVAANLSSDGVSEKEAMDFIKIARQQKRR